MFLVKSLMITNASQDQLNSPETCIVFKIYLTYARILRFLRISQAGTLKLRFATFSRKSLETMFCLIWYGLVTPDFTSRIFKNLRTTLRPVYSMACFSSRQKTRSLCFNFNKAGVEIPNHGFRNLDIVEAFLKPPHPT